MAKKAANVTRPEYLHNLLKEATSSVKKKVKCDVRVPPDVGVYLPHISLRYLFKMNIIPFCRFYQIFGASRSCKSSFLYYLYKLIRQADGVYHHISAEDKDSRQLRLAVLDEADPSVDRPTRVGSINDYMRATNSVFKVFRDAMIESGKADIPCMVGIDSLSGKLAEATYEAFEKEGGAGNGQRYAIEAKLINDFMKVVTNYMIGYPFIVVGVNHDHTKPKQYGQGLDHHTPGGFTQGYSASNRVYTKHIKDIDRDASGEAGHEIEFEIYKGSMGPTGERVRCEFKWKYERNEDGTDVKQLAWWDWHKATCTSLMNVIEDKGERGKAIKDLLGLYKINAGKWYCKAVGVDSKNPIDPSTLGQMIEADVDLTAKIDAILEVRKCTIYQPGDDFRKFLDMDYGTDATTETDDDE